MRLNWKKSMNETVFFIEDEEMFIAKITEYKITRERTLPMTMLDRRMLFVQYMALYSSMRRQFTRNFCLKLLYLALSNTIFIWPIQTSSSVNVCSLDFVDFVLKNGWMKRKLNNYKFLYAKTWELFSSHHKISELTQLYQFMDAKLKLIKSCLPIERVAISNLRIAKVNGTGISVLRADRSNYA